MFKAVVFDMDGVIFDSEKLYRRFEAEVGRELGATDDLLSLLSDRMAGGTKATNRYHFEELMGPVMAESGKYMEYEDFRSEFMRRMDAYTEANGMELKPGVKELFQFLFDNHIKIALATSTHEERAAKHLKANGLYDYFDAMVYGGTVAKGKPAPDIYLKACELLSVKPEEAVGVEDSINGIISASDAGMYAVMVVDLIPPNDVVREKASQIYDSIIQVEELFTGC